jgi:hypothetical protein
MQPGRMTDREVYEKVLAAISGQPDAHGEVHVDCPMCGKEAKKHQTHFSFRYDQAQDVAGGYCFVCDGSISIRQLAEHYGIDVGGGSQLTEQELRIMRLEAEQRRQAAKQAELERRLSALEQMHRCQDHLRYHNQMNDEHRAYWRSQGIYERAMDNFVLGYCEKCPTCRQSPSYTIPVFGYNSELVNIRHRLTDEVGGKYRPHLAGLGSQLFGADVLKQAPERVLILEGEKKAIVYRQHGFNAVGTMGKSYRWRQQWFDWFEGTREIIVCLDPDAEANAWNLGELFVRAGFRGARVATFPVKPDEMIFRHGATIEDVEAILNTARPVWTRN